MCLEDQAGVGAECSRYRRWRTRNDVSKPNSAPPAPSPPPPARSPSCSTPSSPAKSNSTTLSGTPPTLSVNDESKLDSCGKLVDSATNSFLWRSLPSSNLTPSEHERRFLQSHACFRHPASYVFVNLRITSDLLVIQTGNRIDVVQLRSRRGDDCDSSMAASHNEQSHVVGC
jgi:hypothetical protein